jgi:hypothetical protein
MKGQALRRFQLAFTWALIAWAAVNAASFFFRSRGWGNLLGTQPGSFEAIGFPWIVWEQGRTYGGHFCHVPALAANTGVGLAIGLVAGLVAVPFGGKSAKQAPRAPRIVEAGSLPGLGQLQYSLRTLLVVTAIVAVVLAIAQAAVASRPGLLAVVYLLGPAMIIIVWMRFRRIVVWQRGLVVVTTTFLLVLSAAILGQTIDTIDDFTKGILGTFVFWIPQCTLVGLLAVVLRSTAFSGGR